jgi:hypothetical protein
VLLVEKGFFQKTSGDNNCSVSQESMAIVDRGRGGTTTKSGAQPPAMSSNFKREAMQGSVPVPARTCRQSDLNDLQFLQFCDLLSVLVSIMGNDGVS